MTVGFIGTGHIGRPMAANVLAASGSMVTYDAVREHSVPLEEAGATRVEDVAAVGSACDVVFMSLPGPREVEAVVAGKDGLFDTMKSGGTIIDLTTNSPSLVRRLAEDAAERGLAFLDAPVSGGVRRAAKGQLAVMVGGDRKVFERHEDLLGAIGNNVFFVGDAGAGNVAKLVNNMLAFVIMQANNEALVLGTKAGVDPNMLYKIIKASSGSSMVWDNGSRAILRDRLQPTFTVNLACKDIGLATDLAGELDVPMRMVKNAEALLKEHQANGFAEEDVLATVKALESVAGCEVRGTWNEDA